MPVDQSIIDAGMKMLGGKSPADQNRLISALAANPDLMARIVAQVQSGGQLPPQRPGTPPPPAGPTEAGAAYRKAASGPMPAGLPPNIPPQIAQTIMAGRGGSEAQTPDAPPAGMRLARQTDLPMGGITPGDIQRMMSDPSRYGGIYARDAPAATRAAAGGPGTTGSTTTAPKGKPGTPKGTPVKPDPETPPGSSFPWWLLPLGLARRKAQAKAEGETQKQLGYDKKNLPAVYEAQAKSEGGRVNKLLSNITDADFTEINPLGEKGPARLSPAQAKIAAEKARGASAVDDFLDIIKSTTSLASPLKRLPGPPDAPEAKRAKEGETIAAPDKTPEKTVNDIIKEAQAGAKTKSGRPRTKMPKSNLDPYRLRIKGRGA